MSTKITKQENVVQLLHNVVITEHVSTTLYNKYDNIQIHIVSELEVTYSFS